jgi:DNA mismatch repair protein MutS
MATTEAREEQSLLEIYTSQGREVSPHLKAALSVVSREHPSGIALAQLDTPMMRQYRAAKEESPGALLFFRMGDFFELFGLDAIIAADVCGLTLTSRDKGSDAPVPMAGVPVVAHRSALRKCIQAGFSVAVCDQVEDPRQAKGIVRREITRIATPAVPGDLGESDDGAAGAAPDASEGCYLACAVARGGSYALAFVDVSTGEFRLTGGLSRESLEEEFLTLRPREILCEGDALGGWVTFARARFSNVPRVAGIEPWIGRSERDAKALFGEFFAARDIARFGLASVEGGLVAVCGILAYLKHTQKGVLRNLRSIATYAKADHLLLDEATKRHLDFFSTASGERKGSLFWFLNRCATAAGARALARRMNYPFKTEPEVRASLACVREILDRPDLESALGRLLASTADIDRLLARTAQGSIDPKGLAWLRQSLAALPRIESALKEHGAAALDARLAPLRDGVGGAAALCAYLEASFDDEPASQLGKGGRVFRHGFSPELDEVVALETDFDALIAALETREKERTGISTLRVGYTRVFGYYFEVSKGRLSQVPAHFLRKQTLTNGERFITEELKELEEKALVASERRGVLERELFEGLKARVLEYADALGEASRYFAEVDLARAFAALAAQYGWCEPEVAVLKETTLRASTHPILAAMASAEDPFVANDVAVGESHGDVLLITGPNMAGKSTVMRQVAIAQVLFQMGCFVPAKAARMRPCDRLFTRIGSGDFALRAQSTFMVEMLETAHILRNATRESLILMDELGRGTSTFDGLSLAWSILEDLHDRVGARTLFSTHYHEILAVTAGRPRIVPMQMEVIERERDSGAAEAGGSSRWEILFSRRFKPGAAGKSYGLHVAEMAGLADTVVRRAGELLAHLGESGQEGHPRTAVPVVAPEALKAPEAPSSREAYPLASEDKTLEALREADPDAMSPRDALDFLYALKDSLEQGVAPRRARKRVGARAVDETLF